MLLWKLIQNRWHLTYEQTPICRLATLVAQETQTSVCLACHDSLADGVTQWRNLNLK